MIYYSYKTLKMTDITSFLILLSLLLFATFDAINANSVCDVMDGDNDDCVNDTKLTSKTTNNNVDGKSMQQHKSGDGLRWQNLGVSLEKCGHTTAHMLDKYKSMDSDHKSDSPHCLDDSVWLLHPTSGFVENGCVCGIIGPSGAGKSTFLNALGGSTPRSSGVFLTGSVWYEENVESAKTNSLSTNRHRYQLSQQEGDVAMLSQHDNFFAMLTPRETLEFAAYLESQKQRATVGDSDSNKIYKYNYKEVAEQKLASLGLLGVADRKIGDRTRIHGGGGGHSNPLLKKLMTSGGGLSGGEMRRLSCALELITEPKIFLADEPTTGLDSSQAGKVVNIIARLAKERNVPSIMSLHQPKFSIYKTLDQIILLAPGGKMCYAGDVDSAIEYFKNIGFDCPDHENPAEYFIDLVTIDSEDTVQAALDKTRINLLHHRFLESCTAVSSQLSSTNNKTIMKQQQTRTNRLMMLSPRSITKSVRRFGALLRRSWRQNIRNTPIIVIRLGASIAQAALFSSIFTSVQEGKSLTKSIADRVALLTYGVINMSILALMKSLDLFAKERSVVVREQMRNNYFSIEYLMAKVLAEIPLDTSFALAFAYVLKSLTGLRSSMKTLIQTYCLMTITSASLGFAIGSFTSSVESAMSTGLPIMVVFMVLGIINPSGVDTDEAPNHIMKILSFFSPIKWAVESLVTAEFSGMVFEKDKGLWGQIKDLPRMGALSMVKDGNEVLLNLGLGTSEYSELVMNLVVLASIYLSISLVGLSFFRPQFASVVENE